MTDQQLRDRIAGLRSEWICGYSQYEEPLEDQAWLSCGDVHPLRKWDQLERGSLYCPDHLAGSDYSGNSVTASNYRVFLARFRRHVEKGIWPIRGGHGSYGIAIRLDLDDAGVWETLAALEDYPVLDETDLALLESEREEEAFISRGITDFRRALTENYPEHEDALWDAADNHQDWMREVFERTRRAAGFEWIHGTGDQVSIDVARVAAAVDLDTELARIAAAKTP